MENILLYVIMHLRLFYMIYFVSRNRIQWTSWLRSRTGLGKQDICSHSPISEEETAEFWYFCNCAVGLSRENILRFYWEGLSWGEKRIHWSHELRNILVIAQALPSSTGVVTAKAYLPSEEAPLLSSSFQPVNRVEKTLGRSMWNHPFSDGFCELVWVPFVTVMEYKLESFFPHKRFCKKNLILTSWMMF